MADLTDRALLRAVGTELREIRERLGLSLEDAAELFERSSGRSLQPRTLLSYEYGTRKMSVPRLRQWGVVYGVPWTVIVTLAERRATGADPVCDRCGRPS